MSVAERLALFLGFVALAVLFIASQRIWKRAKLQARESWLMCDGHVEKATVTAITAENSQCEIAYSYRVDGEAYGGCFRLNCNDEQGAWDILQPFQDRTLRVRFDPRHPTRSAVVEFDRLELSGGRYVR